MPSTYNGIGTHYYGEKNVREYHGVCHNCKHFLQLKSYDTGLYFVFVYIPLLPLGKKRIIDYCVSCTGHRAVPLKDFQHLTDVAASAYEALKAKPTETTAREALKAAVHCWDQPLVLEVGKTIEALLPTDAESLRLVANCYAEFLYKPVEAERPLRMALDVKDEPATRELLAISLLGQGKPMEAEPFLRHIVEEGIPDRIDLIYWLAQSFQSKGEHVMAVAYFEHCLALNPALSENKEFQLLKATSEKNIDKQTKVEAREVIEGAKNAVRNKWLSIAFVSVVVAILVGYLSYAFYLGRRHPVYLVNGLNTPSTFLVNGQSFTLKPREVSQASFPEGNLTVEMVDPKPIDPPQTFLMSTPLLMRPWGRVTFVVNPDRTAVLARTTYYYAANPQMPTYMVQTGDTLHAFGSCDYDFTAPPDKVSTKSGSASKTVLDRWESVIGHEEDLAVLVTAEKYLAPQAVIQLARRRLFFNPSSQGVLQYLFTQQKPDEFVKTVQPLLDQRPVNLELHRFCQDAMDKVGQEAALQGYYREALKKEPANPELIYLSYRIQRDRARALQAALDQIKNGHPPKYAYSILAHIYAGDGDFPAAAQAAASVVKSQTVPLDRVRTIKSFLPLYIGAKRFDEASAALEPLFAESPRISLAAYPLAIQVAVAKGDMKRANEIADELESKAGRIQHLDKALARTIRVSNIAYATGDFTTFLRETQGQTERNDLFTRAIIDKNLADARKLIMDSPDQTHVVDCLTLYIAASQAPNPKIAQEALDLTIAKLSKNGYDERLWAATLSGKQSPLFADLRSHIPDGIGSWPLYLTTLGLARPEYKTDAFALAKSLTLIRTFPYHTIAAVLEK